MSGIHYLESTSRAQTEQAVSHFALLMLSSCRSLVSVLVFPARRLCHGYIPNAPCGFCIFPSMSPTVVSEVCKLKYVPF